MRGVALAAMGVSVVVAAGACGHSYAEQGGAAADAATVDGTAGELDAAPSDAPACDPGQTTSDPRNCGACGHDCLGGGCVDAACTPVLVAETHTAPVNEIALTHDDVYWLSLPSLDGAGALESCPKTGCSAPQPISYPNQALAALGSDGDTRLFAGGLFATAGLYQVENLGLKPVVPSLQVKLVEVLPTSTVFTSYFEDAGTGRSIRRWDGVTTTTECVFTDSVSAYSGTYSAQRAYLYGNSVGAFYTCPLGGTNAPFTTFVSGTYPVTFAGTSKGLFWVVGDFLSSCADGATCPASTIELAKADLGGATVTMIVAVGAELFLETSDGRLLACDPSSCRTSLRPIVRGADFDPGTYYPRNIAADARAIYYATVGTRVDGGATSWRIMKIAR